MSEQAIKVTGKTEAKAAQAEMAAICEGLTTKSAKIRALHAAGYSKMAISVHLEIIYQHVRNVLNQKTKNG